MPALPKAVFSAPMKVGDSTLMMLLSLNLLLLVFFMLLNSMATYGKKHAEEVLAEVRGGYSADGPGTMRESAHVPEVPAAAWRMGVITRLQGVVINRIDLRTPPKEGNANSVEMVLPANVVFGADGRILQPELVRNIMAAAGPESRITWQVAGQPENATLLAQRMAKLVAETGRAEVVNAPEESLRVIVIPGATTKPEMGLNVQSVGEAAGGRVEGVESKGTVGE